MRITFSHFVFLLYQWVSKIFGSPTRILVELQQFTIFYCRYRIVGITIGCAVVISCPTHARWMIASLNQRGVSTILIIRESLSLDYHTQCFNEPTLPPFDSGLLQRGERAMQRVQSKHFFGVCSSYILIDTIGTFPLTKMFFVFMVPLIHVVIIASVVVFSSPCSDQIKGCRAISFMYQNCKFIRASILNLINTWGTFHLVRKWKNNR